MDIKAHVGIGDLIYMKAMMDTGPWPEINICADKDIIRVFRNDSSEFKIFLNKLMAMLFTAPRYNIVDNNNAPSISHVELKSHHKLKIIKPSFKHLLPKGTDLNVGPYIVITTKIRHIPRQEYDTFKLRLIDSLNRLSTKFKIVIMGEKAVGNNAENIHYGPNEIYSIYDDIKSVNNVLDLSIAESADFDFDKFLQDCYLMSMSHRTLTLGIGGNLALALAFSNIIGYHKKNACGYTFIEEMFAQSRQGDSYVTTKIDNFISELNLQAR